jgi:hypothetical protein
MDQTSDSIKTYCGVDQLVDERTLADMLFLPIRTLQDWRVRGFGPPFFKLGKMVRYSVPEVLEWLDDDCRKDSTWE